MKFIDLTHVMHSKMPVFPGTETPVFQPANTIDKDGFSELRMTMYSHTGTHMDAPFHMKRAGLTLDQYPIEHFIGRAVILDLTKKKNRIIDVDDLVTYEEKLKNVDFVILKTGWSRYWGKENYFKNFPALSIDAAEWLVGFKLKGIGIDAISIDNMESTAFPVHHILFENNIVIIENLANLDAVNEAYFTFSCLPLKHKAADGSPVRAIAMEGVWQE